MHIAFTPVYVSNQDDSLEFFLNKMGFEKRMDERFGDDFRWIVVAPPGHETGLILASGYGAADPEARVGVFTGIVFNTDDIDGEYERLFSAGVEFTEPPAAQPWGGIQAQFVDPDGNGFVLTKG